MKTLSIIAVLVTVSIHSTFAVTSPTTTSPTVANATTSSLLLSAIAADSTGCGDTPEVCPSCDGQSITDGSGVAYEVHCNTTLTLRSTGEYEVTNTAAVKVIRECLQACDEFEGCLGASYDSSDGQCILTTDTFAYSPGNGSSDTFKRLSGASAGISTSTTAATSTRSQFALSPTKCPLENITCPACDGTEVTDPLGKMYTVFCDFQLFANDQYSIQRWTSPQGCLAECDNYTSCQGSTFWPQGNCELASGGDVFPQEQPGYTAFLPFATGGAPAPPSPASPSRFPTGSVNFNHSISMHFTQSHKRATSTTHRTSPAVTAGPFPTLSTACDPFAARCPQCNGWTIDDNLNSTYQITCASEPICQSIVHRANQTSQKVCLDYCDADPVCFAAIWDKGSCRLCDGALDGLLNFVAPPEYVVFLVKSPMPGCTNTTTGAASLTSMKSAIPETQSPKISITTTISSLSIATAFVGSTTTSVISDTLTTAVSITTTTLSSLSATISPEITQPASSSSVSFVLPLTDGSVSFAVPGGQTRALGG